MIAAALEHVLIETLWFFGPGLALYAMAQVLIDLGLIRFQFLEDEKRKRELLRHNRR